MDLIVFQRLKKDSLFSKHLNVGIVLSPHRHPLLMIWKTDLS